MASWFPPNPTNGIIISYTVCCRISSDQLSISVKITVTIVNDSTLSTTLMGLMPFTSYECYVTANTSAGEGSPSSNDTAMTDEDGGLIFNHAL